MTAPVLSFRHVFGFKSDVLSPLHYIDDATVLFAAGHQLVLHNTHTRQQRTIPASYDTQPHARSTCRARLHFSVSDARFTATASPKPSLTSLCALDCVSVDCMTGCMLAWQRHEWATGRY